MTTSVDYLFCNVEQEQFCIATQYVLRVCQLSAITPAPVTTKGLTGFIQVDGSIVPAVDIAELVYQQEGGERELQYAIVLQYDAARLAILADSLWLRQVPLAQINAADTTPDSLSTGRYIPHDVHTYQELSLRKLTRHEHINNLL